MTARNALEISVECYAGYRGEESPQSFYLGDRHIKVVDILDRWLAPEHRYFKLKGDDGGVYIVRHDNKAGVWEMIFFDNGMRPETRLSSC